MLPSAQDCNFSVGQVCFYALHMIKIITSVRVAQLLDFDAPGALRCNFSWKRAILRKKNVLILSRLFPREMKIRLSRDCGGAVIVSWPTVYLCMPLSSQPVYQTRRRNYLVIPSAQDCSHWCHQFDIDTRSFSLHPPSRMIFTRWMTIDCFFMHLNRLCESEEEKKSVILWNKKGKTNNMIHSTRLTLSGDVASDETKALLTAYARAKISTERMQI